MKKVLKQSKEIIASDPNLSAFIRLFSFGGLARAIQFLVPLLIYSLFKPSKQLDFYFYWTTQSNLIVSFISAIWPTVLSSLLVKVRSQYQSENSITFASYLLNRFTLWVIPLSILIAFLSSQMLLGGPEDLEEQMNYLYFLIITISTGCLSVAISEIATANRKFGVFYQGILISALIQLSIVAIFRSEFALLISFVAGSIAQLICCIIAQSYKVSTLIKLAFSVSQLSREKLLELKSSAPNTKLISLLYLGGLSTLASSHFAYRFLSTDEIGAVSAFAMASMIALGPQQLFVQNLSTVAGVAMTEALHKTPNEFTRISFKWRNRLFRLSLILGFSLAASSILLLLIFKDSQSFSASWLMVINMLALLSLPLSISGLNTWIARLSTSLEKFESSVFYQISVNLITILLLFYLSKNTSVFSSPLALALSALIQIFTMPIYLSYLGYAKIGAKHKT